MKGSLKIILIVAGIALLLYFMFSGAYNTMVTKQENTRQKWALVESQYQRRNDLYNSVVKTIQGSANFERGTLKDVIEARAAATSVKVDPSNLSPEEIQKFQAAQNQYNTAFSRLLVTVEQYPQLQTTAAFRDFQTQQEGTENRINKARNDFNDAVQDFNTTIKRFPRNIIAGMFGFREKGYFTSAAGSEKVPDIQFQ